MMIFLTKNPKKNPKKSQELDPLPNLDKIPSLEI